MEAGKSRRGDEEPTGRKAPEKCTSIELCCVLLGRIIDDGEWLRKLTLMYLALFFAVAMAEEVFEEDPGILLLDDDDGKRVADPSRRARFLPGHIILLWICVACHARLICMAGPRA